MDAYSVVFQKGLFPVWESRIRRRPTLEHLRKLERSQWASLDELEHAQSEELGRLVRHAVRNVPYYQQRFRELGLAAEDIRSIDDLEKLPVMSRDEARATVLERASVADPLPTIKKMTSGTTGAPLAFGYDVGSEHWRQAVKLRGYGWAGYHPGYRSVHFWGTLDALYPKPLLPRVKVLADRALRREYYVDCTDRSEEYLARVVRTIGRLAPHVLLCYAQAGVALARHVLEKGGKRWNTLPVICGAERVFPHDRPILTEAFGPHVFETYGSREFMLIATECEAHDGLHVSMENLIVEVLVREGDRYRPAAPGETGEVAITDLHNYGLPFIRYLNGDLAVRHDGKRCSCGRSLERLASIEGRRNDTLYDGAGRPVSGLFFNVLFSVLAGSVRQFQVVQKRDRSIVLKIVPAGEFGNGLIEHVRESCRKFLPGCDLDIAVVDSIPVEPSGKLRVVVVES